MKFSYTFNPNLKRQGNEIFLPDLIFLVMWFLLNHLYGIRFRLSSLSITRFCAAVFRADYVAPRTIFSGESRLMTPEIVSIAESLFDNGQWILGVF